MSANPDLPFVCSGPDAQPPSADLPPSYNQERLLVGKELRGSEQTQPASDNILECLCLEGRLRRDCLETALNQVFARHTGLRTSFFPDEAVPKHERSARLAEVNLTRVLPLGLYRQVVSPTVELNLVQISLNSRHLAIQNQECIAVLSDLLGRPFTFDRAPLVRATLVQRSEADHLLVLVFSHLLTDRWSQRVLRRDLRGLYRAAVTGAGPHLPKIGMHYPEFAAWQRRSQLRPQSVEYWLSHWPQAEQGQLCLKGLPYFQPHHGPASAAYEEIGLDAATTSEMKLRARQARLTLSTIFATALAIELHTRVEQPVVSFWISCANRRLPGTPETVGWFANSFLIPFEFEINQSLADALRNARARLMEAGQHEDIPLLAVWAKLGRTREPAVLRVAFEFLNEEPIEHPDETGIAMNRLPRIFTMRLQPPGGLRISALDQGRVIRLFTSYMRECFAALAVRRLMGRILKTSLLLLAEPQMSLSEIRRALR